jgi:STE24 endopeptidase
MPSLTITPVYTQGGPSTENSDSFFGRYALFATLAFTATVFLFETYLSLRQRSSYFKTEFPSELKTTVSRIDEEEKKSNSAKNDDGAAKPDNSTDAKLDKSQPLLPQLEAKFSKAQSYGQDKVFFSIVSSTYSVIEEIVYLLYGFYPYVWDAACSIGSKYFGWDESTNEIKVSLIFMAIVTVIGLITQLPFDIYSTFFIEKKHGFNKQTPKLFVEDKIKGLALEAVFGGFSLAAILKLIKWGGDKFYIYVWAFAFAFTTFMMTIAPVFIMPLFNKYDPLPEGELKKQIFDLAGRLKFPLTKLFVMDGSKRSSHSNAFMFGFFNNKR